MRFVQQKEMTLVRNAQAEIKTEEAQEAQKVTFARYPPSGIIEMRWLATHKIPLQEATR